MKQGVCALILFVVTGLTVQGADAADVQMNGNASVSGSMTAGSFSGDGSGLTNLNPATITTGTASINISGNAASSSAVTAGGITAPPLAFFLNGAIVAPVGGNYSNPVDAMTDYLSWCPAPSAATPCLLKIMPGVYNIGANSLQMRQYIDFEGSGENVTAIQGNRDSATAGVINGSTLAELRSLAVTHTGGGTNAVAIYNGNTSPLLTNLKVSASGAANNYGVYNGASGLGQASSTMTKVFINISGGTGSFNYGIYNDGSGNIGTSPTMTYVTILAHGLLFGTPNSTYGVYNVSASPVLTNVTASAYSGTNNYGVYNSSGGIIQIRHSVISGTTNTIRNGSGVTTKVAHTQLDGGAVSNAGALLCAGVYDENYILYISSCP